MHEAWRAWRSAASRSNPPTTTWRRFQSWGSGRRGKLVAAHGRPQGLPLRFDRHPLPRIDGAAGEPRRAFGDDEGRDAGEHPLVGPMRLEGAAEVLRIDERRDAF